MKITKVSLQNFKGHTADYQLADVTVIAGANFSHKTSIPLAIRLGLSGYLPAPLGTRNLYSLAGNPNQPGTMAINLTTDSNRQVGWKWTKNAKGSVSVDGAVTMDMAMPELMLDPRLFFAKTQAEQIQTIFSVCSVDDFEIKSLLDRFNEIQVMPRTVCEATIQDIRKFNADPVGKPQDWLASLIDWLKTMAKAASDEAKIASGAFAAFRATSQPVGKDVSKELAAAKADLDELLKKSGANNGGLESNLAAVKLKREQYRTLDEYDEDLSELHMGCPVDPDEVDEEMDRLITIQGILWQEMAEAKVYIDTKTQEVAKIQTQPCCPTCGSNRKGWRERTIADLESAISSKSQTLLMAETECSNAQDVIQKIKDWRLQQTTKTQLKKERAELVAADQEIAKLETAIASRKQVDNDLPKHISSLRERIAEMEREQEAHNQWKVDAGRKDALESKLMAAQCRSEVYKAAVKIVIEEQQKLIDGAFREVLQVAKYFTDGLLNSPLEFIDGKLGRKVSELDAKAGTQAPVGSWIPFETFSGTEELLALAGFGVALTGDAPIKLVVLDEMGRLDGRRKVDVAQRMLSLTQKGIIDQAILIDVDAKPYAPLAKQSVFKIITV